MHQLAHIETYGTKARTKRPMTWSTAVHVLEEAGRAPGASGHLENPHPATPLYGSSPQTYIPEVLRIAALARDAAGCRLRPDAGVLAAGIASWPVPRSVLEERGNGLDRDIYLGWRQAFVDYLMKTVGDRLLYVVEHRDESHYHVHWGALPRLNADNTLNWARVHPGLDAKRRAAEEGADKKEQERAYRYEMIRWQDEMHAQVSSHWGLSRKGAYKTRLSKMMADYRAKLEAEMQKLREALVLESALRLDDLKKAAQSVWADRCKAIADRAQVAEDANVELTRRVEELNAENARLKERLGEDDAAFRA